MKYASVIIIPVGNQFLSLIKNNRFGLIGGSFDPGETPIQCAVRELHEETGLRSANPTLDLVYLGVKPDETFVWSHLFVATKPLIEVPKHKSPEGKLSIASKSQLLSDKARFPVWNSWAFYMYEQWRFLNGY